MLSNIYKTNRFNWAWFVFYLLIFFSIGITYACLHYKPDSDSLFSAIFILIFLMIDILSHELLQGYYQQLVKIKSRKNSDDILKEFIVFSGIIVTWLILIICTLASVYNFFIS